jgi:predicted flap endonuclease-1-like 5' DNA nuclease
LSVATKEELDMRIDEVEGIGKVFADKLADAGVKTTDDLLEQGATASGRERLAEATGLSTDQLLKWTNHVDLMRIDGVGSEYAELLEAAGVDSPTELAQRNPRNLAQTFQELDAARPNWIRRLPSESMVEGWIAQAKGMGKVLSH